ncbi:16S rRNA (cytidine(1402)-2'-O)-methyltransferase [Natranaerobius trueperi]|uniref:Ribosomal RNA small subunit methyltransferase I n=1 Tax=Natranaerobius trueperi TaxID=759412 RepID=A0A226BXA1_9FIRM|nr:16S rRNA (cytidine(1402)-2'-O)-methyltransferase [Natranaerobius trueperi]OWZ83643.1 16S rRNA (cytidine(1402)-2'-O)-methyltransferase [Natranaerobius trueperi]
MDSNNKGKLYICPTPIGNLKDITLRVIDCLKNVNIIACEDTRRTKKLLNHLDIYHQNLISYHKFNQEKKGENLVHKLNQGFDVALVSDAGTPSISDPGKYLVREAIDNSLTVISLPGPSAVITGLAASGLDTGSFLFLGFIPGKGAQRKQFLNKIISSESTVVLYENSSRMLNTLRELEPHLTDREIVIARELTKIHEEFIRGTANDLISKLESRNFKGEITLLVEGIDNAGVENYFSKLTTEEHLHEVIGEGFSKKDAIKLVSKLRDEPKREVYKKALKLEKEKNDQ